MCVYTHTHFLPDVAGGPCIIGSRDLLFPPRLGDPIYTDTAYSISIVWSCVDTLYPSIYMPIFVKHMLL